MTRSKKSRKPGVGSNGIVKDDKKKALTPAPRRPKKKVGKESGNRQKEAAKKDIQNQQTSGKKDPRIGSKKPIELGKATSQKVVANKTKSKESSNPIAGIRYVEPSNDLNQELHDIENDPRLLQILELQEQEAELSNDDVDFFNEKMDRHAQLRDLLGLDDEDEESEENVKMPSNSEDDLWDKFDNSNLSEFE